MMSPLNQPIANESHGDIPCSTPFRKIDPKDYDLDLGNKNRKQTCIQCWFVNNEKVHSKQFSMHKGDAWTSGAPLLKDNYLEILDLAAESGYGTISMTFHGVFDENINFKSESEYPIKGVFHGKSLEIVVQRIKHYNLNRKAKDQLRINIGITIGKHNHQRESLIRYVHYFNNLGVDTVIFNNFTDHGGQHPDLPLLKEEIEAFYRNIRWIHENVEMKFQLALNEDFGLPLHVGNCQAGR